MDDVVGTRHRTKTKKKKHNTEKYKKWNNKPMYSRWIWSSL